jgi:two-component system sensor histidine kinase DegS
MKNSGKASLDTISFKNLRRLYLFALLTIAVTVLLSQLLIQYNLNSQLSDSKIINISGKQRMLSQRLTKEVLILNFVTDSIKIKQEITRLNETITHWKFNHYALENGNDSLGFPKEKTPDFD